MPGRLHRSVLLGVVGMASLAFAQTPTVVPTAQTAAADAGPLLPSVWVNASNVDDSRVLSTDGVGNLIEFALDGGTFASQFAGASDLGPSTKVSPAAQRILVELERFRSRTAIPMSHSAPVARL